MTGNDIVCMIATIATIPCWLWLLMVAFTIVVAIDTFLGHKNTPM